MFGLFRDILDGNLRGMNQRYFDIGRTHKDRFLGGMIFENDHKNNMGQLEKTEKAMATLFEKVEENRKFKQEIISRLGLTSSDLRVSAQELHRHMKTAKIFFDTEAFFAYKDAYELSLKGDTNAIRDAATEYRIKSNVLAIQLTALNAQIMQLYVYLERDIKCIEYYWKLYQDDEWSDVKGLLQTMLANQIEFDDEKSLMAYIGGIEQIDQLIKEGKKWPPMALM